MSPAPFNVTLRVLGLVASGLLAAFVALALLLESDLFAAMHPLPLAFAFALIAAICFAFAVWLRANPD